MMVAVALWMAAGELGLGSVMPPGDLRGWCRGRRPGRDHRGERLPPIHRNLPVEGTPPPLTARPCPFPIQKPFTLLDCLPMNLRSCLARMFGALIVTIALLASPSVATAHEGHRHSGSHMVSAQSPAAEAALASSAVDAGSTDLRAASDGVPSRGCAGTCCAGAPCGGCVAVSLVDSHRFGPDPSAQRAPVREPARVSGIAPDGLRKPPRSFI